MGTEKLNVLKKSNGQKCMILKQNGANSRIKFCKLAFCEILVCRFRRLQEGDSI